MNTITLVEMNCPNCNGVGKNEIPVCWLPGCLVACPSGWCDCNKVTVECGCKTGKIMVREGTKEIWKPL